MLPPILDFNDINRTIIPSVNEYNVGDSFHSVTDFDDGGSFYSENILSNISVTQSNNSTSISENHNYIKELPVDYNLKGTIYLPKSCMLNSSSPPALCWALCTTNSYRTKKTALEKVSKHCFGVYCCSKCDFKERPITNKKPQRRKAVYLHQANTKNAHCVLMMTLI